MRATAIPAWHIGAVTVCLVLATVRPAGAACQLGGTDCGDPTAVGCNPGVVCFFPWRSCSGCTCTTTEIGQTCLATDSEPGTVPMLLLSKSGQTAGDLELSWGASCAASAPDYAIDEGQLGLWYSHAPRTCSSGHALAMTITPAGGDRYYVIAPIVEEFTGSLGTGVGGAERPDGDPSCTAHRALAPCP